MSIPGSVSRSALPRRAAAVAALPLLLGGALALLLAALAGDASLLAKSVAALGAGLALRCSARRRRARRAAAAVA